jgi:hypothetical protein
VEGVVLRMVSSSSVQGGRSPRVPLAHHRNHSLAVPVAPGVSPGSLVQEGGPRLAFSATVVMAPGALGGGLWHCRLATP